jgi:HEPN domain-containing protein
MDRSLVTETAEELLVNAERDIINVNILLSKKFYPEDLMYIPICFHATMAVEKLLKSYIISNGKDIKKTHDLEYLCESAANIDASFAKIANDNTLLNTFVPRIKYSNKIPLTKQDINNIVKSLNVICDFPLIQAMRDSFRQIHKFEIIE